MNVDVSKSLDTDAIVVRVSFTPNELFDSNVALYEQVTTKFRDAAIQTVALMDAKIRSSFRNAK